MIPRQKIGRKFILPLKFRLCNYENFSAAGAGLAGLEKHPRSGERHGKYKKICFRCIIIFRKAMTEKSTL